MNRFLVILLILPFICFAEISCEIPANITEHPNWRLLNSDGCGIASSERIVGGVDAPMGAYPWLARIGYVEADAPWSIALFKCAGAAINELYILTAAHCVTNTPRNQLPVRVRLGEHNLETNPDCDDSFCNDPYQDYDIAEVIPHEGYIPVSQKNDIALIRVKKPITFTDFVRPVCVVKGHLLEKDFTGKIVEVAGWGVFDVENPGDSTILQVIKLPVLPVTDCSDHPFYEQFSIDSRQMCLGGMEGMDSCNGDSGGPVMRIEARDEGAAPRYHVIAVVSFGPGDCGEENLAGVYTDVSKYILWILDHLRA